MYIDVYVSVCACVQSRHNAEARVDGFPGSFLQLSNSSVIFTKRSGWLCVTPRHLKPFSIIARVPGGGGDRQVIENNRESL